MEEAFVAETFNCRKGKGNMAAIAHLDHAIRECSNDYTADCWVMRVDLQGFFMSINRQLLCDKLCRFIEARYTDDDLDTLLFLTRTILLNAPEDNCLIKGLPKEWTDLPANKSLFTTAPGFGLPIGNLTSQLTANFLLNDTDHFIREDLGLHMARYVDDICIVDADKQRLLAAVPAIRQHLAETAGVTLHPRKFYLQHYTKGIQFVGAVVKPGRTYISNRTVANAHRRIHGFNQAAREAGYVERSAERFAQSLNSYLGIMSHYSSFAIRHRIVSMIGPEWHKVITVAPDFSKVSVKKRYKHRERIKYVLKKKRKQHKNHENNKNQQKPHRNGV